MIPLNLDDTDVLRRTLEEIESQLMVTPPITNIQKINPAPELTNAGLMVKLNEVIGVVNSITTLINSVQASEIS